LTVWNVTFTFSQFSIKVPRKSSGGKDSVLINGSGKVECSKEKINLDPCLMLM
jgi:hypothetical protein